MHRGRRENDSDAFCRKVITLPEDFEVWGDRKHTWSLTFIEKCVDGILHKLQG